MASKIEYKKNKQTAKGVKRRTRKNPLHSRKISDPGFDYRDKSTKERKRGVGQFDDLGASIMAPYKGNPPWRRKSKQK